LEALHQDIICKYFPRFLRTQLYIDPPETLKMGWQGRVSFYKTFPISFPKTGNVLFSTLPAHQKQAKVPSQGRMGGTETMWVRVGVLVTMRQKLRKRPTKSCIHGAYGP
jgi:hypothetical protein